jgi:precorrin-3B C17-methyltransferase
VTGRLAIVGTGPGDPEHLTPAAAGEISGADVLVGYRAYIDLIPPQLRPSRVEASEIGQERERAQRAATAALAGERVALISSGDAGIYGMAALALDELHRLAGEGPMPEIMVVPGVTAASAAAALLGAPLALDFACLSLSDLLVPWTELKARIDALVAADVVLALYNPRSKTRVRPWQYLVATVQGARPGNNPVGVVRRAMRPGQSVTVTDVAGMGRAEVDMETVVIVGSSRTRRAGNFLLTLRDWSLQEVHA